MRETPGWERISVQLDSRAIDAACPKEVAKAFEMKETIVSKRGIGFEAVNVSGIKNCGGKKLVGRAGDGEGVSLRIQRVDVENVLGSVHKMNVGGSVVVLDGDERLTQSKTTEKTGYVTSRASESRASGCR